MTQEEFYTLAKVICDPCQTPEVVLGLQGFVQGYGVSGRQKQNMWRPPAHSTSLIYYIIYAMILNIVYFNEFPHPVANM